MPEVGSSRKFTHRRSVLFPDPDLPKMTTTSPWSTSMSIPLSTSRLPKDLWRFSTLTTAFPFPEVISMPLSREFGSTRRLVDDGGHGSPFAALTGCG